MKKKTSLSVLLENKIMSPQVALNLKSLIKINNSGLIVDPTQSSKTTILEYD